MPKRTRRQFLEDSMIATAAAVAVPDQLFVDDERQSRSPNQRLGVAVLGVRGRGSSHIGALAGRRDTQITYICDPDLAVGKRRAAEVEKRQGRLPRFVEDLRHVLDDPSVDIVTIATPNHWHALAAIWAMQAGKDVYVEKPVSHNVSEGRRMVQAARRHQRICQTGTQCRSNPGMMDAMAFLQAGKLGEVKLARGLCYKQRRGIGERGQFAPPVDVNYDLWLGPAPDEPLSRSQFHVDWHWQWAYGNGDLGNQGVHQMDLARWGLGVQRLSESVFSFGGRFGPPDAGETPNTQVVVHRFADKTLVFEVRGLETAPYRDAKTGVVFEGSDGFLVMTSYQSGAAFDLSGQKIQEFQGSGDHFANFLKAVRSRNRADLNADIEQGHLSSALCHLGNISYRLGSSVPLDSAKSRLLEMQPAADDTQDALHRTLEHLRDQSIPGAAGLQLGMPLTFDPVSETITNHTAANSLLTREYRPPFVVPAASDV